MKVLFKSLVLILFLSSYGFAGATINFKTDVSSEFPSTTVYNAFVNKLKSSFHEAIKFQESFDYLPLATSSFQIDRLVKKFTFGYICNSLIKNEIGSEENLTESLKWAPEYDTRAGMLFYFGVPLHKKVSIFINTSFYVVIPIGLTVLWKVYETKELKKFTNKSYSKMYLSFTVFYSFLNITPSKIKRGNNFSYNNSNLQVNSSNEIINLIADGITDAGDSSFTFDLSFKYNFMWRWLNLNVCAGLGIQIINIERKFLIDTNVDYIGSGSATGVDSKMEVKFDDSWITYTLHLDIAVSFNILKWLRVPVIGVSLVYNSIAGYHIGVSMGMVMEF